MSPALVARCPAKVNLRLRVLGRRPDGFHELETVFQAVGLWDRLEARPAETISLTCDDPSLPTDGSNLVVRAAEALRRHRGLGQGAALHLSKGIPHGAGLGGGSSDAAGALRLCAALWGIRPEPGELEALAAALGSDVAFFLVGGTALGTGRGERLERWAADPPRPLVIGTPSFPISTAEVYRRLALTPSGNGDSLPGVSAHKWRKDKDFSLWLNDLERVVIEGWPALRAFRDDLRRHDARVAMVSGSGSSVFGVFDSVAQRDRAAAALETAFDGWRVERVTTVDRGVAVTE